MSEMFSLDFFRMALFAGSITAVICGYLGVFIVLRRVVFVGIALAAISSLGVAVAIFLGKDPTAFSLAFAALGVLLLAFPHSERRLSPESIIGLAYASATAGGILFLSKSAHGEADMLSLIFGNILGITSGDIKLMLFVFIPALAVNLCFYREILFSAFDPDMAKTLGIKTHLWNVVFYLSIGLVSAAAIKALGVLLVFSLLVVPAMIGLNLAENVKGDFLVAITSALIATWGGLILSYIWDFPSAPMIIAFCFFLFLLSLVTGKFLKK